MSSSGTLFRVYTPDNSKHYTAVLLKDGKVLEVKNPDTNAKTIFDSVELWQNSHPDCTLKVDASKGSGVVIGSNTNGFNYPTENHLAYYFVRWLYSIITEAAPHLLKSEEFRDLYNNMVELCNKHKNELEHHNSDFTGIRRYSPINRDICSWKKNWEGYPGYFYYENHYNHTKLHYTAIEYDNARNEIIALYKKIVQIVEPEVKEYMALKYNILATKKRISEAKILMKNRQKKIDNIQKSVNLYKSTIEKEMSNLNNLEEEFLVKNFRFSL